MVKSLLQTLKKLSYDLAQWELIRQNSNDGIFKMAPPQFTNKNEVIWPRSKSEEGGELSINHHHAGLKHASICY